MEKINKEQCDGYNIIFQGKVDSVSICDGKAIAYFNVLKLFKGDASQQMPVQFDCSTSCQMSFEKNQVWLIYSKYFKYGKTEVDFCSRSRKFFEEDNKDYFITNNKLTFKEEVDFLEANFTNKIIEKEETSIKESMQERELVQPSPYTKLWLLLASFCILGLFYFVFYKYFKF